MFEYKGLYYDCSNENHFYEGGAHFKYHELYARLEMLAYEINEKMKDNNHSVNNESCIHQNEFSENNNNIIKDNLIEKEKKINQIEKKEEKFNNENKLIFVKTKKNIRPRNVSLNIKNQREKSKTERAMEYSKKLRHINSFSKLNKNFTINIQNKNKLKRNRCNSYINVIKTQNNDKIVDVNNINIKNNFNIEETINNRKNIINNNNNKIKVKKNNI